MVSAMPVATFDIAVILSPRCGERSPGSVSGPGKPLPRRAMVDWQWWHRLLACATQMGQTLHVRAWRRAGFGLMAATLCLAAGVHAQDWPSRKSMGAVISHGNGGPGCPVVVTFVWPQSPAHKAGLQSGDRLLSLDGTGITGSSQAADLIRDSSGDLQFRLWRAGKEFEATVTPEPMANILRRVNKKITPEGIIVPLDASEAEIYGVRNFKPERIAARAFPHHIPLYETTFAAGFEVFLLRDPQEVRVGGIDEGPAADAGVRWGDELLAIDGASVAGKSAQELEAMLSAGEPRRIRLTVARIGRTWDVNFTFQRVADILRRNQRQLVRGQLVPMGVAEEDWRCFLRQER